MLLHLFEVQELGTFLDFERQLFFHLVPQSLELHLVFGFHIFGQLVPLLLVIAKFSVPQTVETSQLLLLRVLEVTMFLVVPLLHLENPSGLEILSELLGCEPVILSFDVVTVLLVLVHVCEGLVQHVFELIGRSAYLEVTHLCLVCNKIIISCN